LHPRAAARPVESERATETDKELLEALTEFPVGPKGSLNRSKIGWILKKNAGRIIDGYRFGRGRRMEERHGGFHIVRHSNDCNDPEMTNAVAVDIFGNALK
jgi:hypothetical protein